MRWFAFAPLPSRVFFVSTKLPTWASSPMSLPGRSRENGPRMARAATVDSCATVYGFTVTPSASAMSVRIAPAPIRQPAPTRVRPLSRAFGSMTVSGPISTPSSQSNRSGSSMVTPARMSADARRRRSTRPARASSSRSFTPEASSGDTGTATAPPARAAIATRSVR